MVRLQSAIKNVGSVTGVTIHQAMALADSLDKVTRFSRLDITSAEALIATYKNINSNIFPATLQAAADMATAMGQDLPAAAKELGIALDNPATGFGRLQRAGVTFSAAQQAAIKALAKTGDIAGADKIILDQLESKFRGAASAAGDTFAGGVDILNHKFDDLKVKVGELVMKTIQPALANVGDFIDKLSEWTDQNPQLVQTIIAVTGAMVIFGPILVGVGMAVSALGSIVKGLSMALALFEPMLPLLIGPLLVIGGVVAAVATNFLGLRDKLQPVLVPLQRFIGALQAGVNPGRAFKMLLSDFLPENILTGFSRIADGIGYFIRDLKDGGIINAIRGAFGLSTTGDPAGGQSWIEGILVGFGMARDAANSAVTKIGGFLQGLAETISTKVIPFFQGVREAVQPVIDVFGRFFSALASGADLGDAFRGLLGGLGDIISNAVSTAFNSIKNFDFGGFIANLGNAIWTALSQIKIGDTTVGGLVDTVLATIRGAIATAGAKIGEIRDDISKALEPIKGVIDTVLGSIGTGLSDIGKGISGFLANLGGADTSGIGPLAQHIAEFIGTIAGAVVAVGGVAIGSLLSGIGAMLPDLGKAVHDFVSVLSDIGNGNWSQVFVDLGKFLQDVGNAVGKGIETFIFDLAVNLGKLLGIDVVGGLAAWTGVIDNLKLVFQAGFQWITDHVVKPFQTLILGFPAEVRQSLLDSVTNIADFILNNQGLFNLLPGGGAYVNVAHQLTGRDSGGQGVAGAPYLIGTGAQPELFVPSVGGNFYPANQLGSSKSVTLNGGLNLHFNVTNDGLDLNNPDHVEQIGLAVLNAIMMA